MTDAERALWARIRANRLGVKFRQQMPIGKYVADFATQGARIVVELDGGQHDPTREGERLRTAAIESAAYVVLRFWNNDVLGNIDGVLQEIASAIESR
ncbi:hypothetical protein BH10PSE9_BH10PSE9_25230 [soil metagenome]